MKVTLTNQAPAEIAVDAIAIAIAPNEAPDPAVRDLDGRLDGLLRDLVGAGEHKGRLFEVLPVHVQGLATRRLLLYGVGATKDLDGARLRNAHSELIRAARTYGFRRLAVLRNNPLTEASLVGAVEGLVAGDWESRIKQTGRREASEVEEILLSGFGTGREHEVVDAVEVGEAVNRAKTWVNMPPNELTPEAFADEGRRVADRTGMEFESLGADELQAGGYNLLLGVAKGSRRPPRLFRLRHRGAEGGPVLALVGKGITFDTGGISIKSADGMSRMKGDMAGGAAVLAAIEAIAARRAPIHVMAVVAASENMPGGDAQRPGDVLASANGKTVEIVNTDAEGRLVLADALTYAIRSGATHIVDLATLTGAAKHVSGHVYTPVVCDDDRLWNDLESAADDAGERLFRLPVHADYKVLLRSRIADLRNAEYGEAGTTLGGLFIGEFTEGRPWAHLDIASTSWNTAGELTTIPRGPNGAGTRTIIRLAERMGATQR